MKENRIEEFKQMSFEKQKEKLVVMLWALKDDEWIFEKALSVIKESGKITSEDLISIYESILDFAQQIRDEEHANQSQTLSKIKTRLDTIATRESLEKEQENPDSLLNNI